MKKKKDFDEKKSETSKVLKKFNCPPDLLDEIIKITLKEPPVVHKEYDGNRGWIMSKDYLKVLENQKSK
jgi:hypothetical protein